VPARSLTSLLPTKGVTRMKTTSNLKKMRHIFPKGDFDYPLLEDDGDLEPRTGIPPNLAPQSKSPPNLPSPFIYGSRTARLKGVSSFRPPHTSQRTGISFFLRSLLFFQPLRSIYQAQTTPYDPNHGGRSLSTPPSPSLCRKADAPFSSVPHIPRPSVVEYRFFSFLCN